MTDYEVLIPGLEKTSVELVNDGECRLMIDESGLGPESFMFTMINGGGFTGLLMSLEIWEEMKRAVDKYLAEKTKPAQNETGG